MRLGEREAKARRDAQIRGAEAFMAGELDVAHLLAEHRAACERIKELESALRVVVAESEMHTFGRSGYDMTLDHLHDVAVSALTSPGCEHRAARPDGNGMALCEDCDSYLLPFMATTDVAQHDSERHDLLDPDDPIVLGCIWCQS